MSTEPMIRFSGTPVEKPDLTPKWERPSNWPRIDLIPIRGISYHVMYLIVRKPAPGHGLCFAATVAANASTWYIERISVSEDGKVVTPVEGSRQTSSGTGSTKIDYQFPAEDPVGTIYAMKVAVTDPTKLFSSCPSMNVPGGSSLLYFNYNSAVILECIVRVHGISASVPNSGANSFVGPTHVAVYAAAKGLPGFGVRGNSAMHFIEFREGCVLDFTDYNRPCFSTISRDVSPCADWDDDLVVRFNPHYVSNLGRFLPYNVRTGATYPLAQVKNITSDGTSTPFDWASSPMMLSGLLSCNQSRATVPHDLPAGFGSNSTALVDLFSYSYCLPHLTLPDGFGSAATNVQSCFNNCTSLQTLALPDGFGSAATNVSNCFNNCTSLQTLALPDGFGSAATNVQSCFQSCNSLENVTGAIKFPVSFDIHWSTKLTHDSLVNIINGLVTVTSTKTLTMGADNKAKLSKEEIAVATAKSWTIA